MKNRLILSLSVFFISSFCFSQGFFQKLKQEIKTNSTVNGNGQNNTPTNQVGVQQQWTKVSFGSQIPQDAVVGGQDKDGKPLIIAHGNYFGATHPGKTRRDWDAAHFEYGGKEETWSDYEVLVGGAGLDWMGVNAGSIPGNAIIGGQ